MQYGKFDVYIDDTAAGRVNISREGILTMIQCRASYNSDEILRLAADVGDGYEMIGVMMPEGEGFALKKHLTKNDVFAKRLDNARKYVLISENTPYKSEEPQAMPQKEEEDVKLWTVCENPELLFNDREAGEAVALCEGVLKAEQDGCVYVAVPTEKEHLFPPVPIFYFGQRGTLNGKEYLLFTLRDGQLQI